MTFQMPTTGVLGAVDVDVGFVGGFLGPIRELGFIVLADLIDGIAGVIDGTGDVELFMEIARIDLKLGAAFVVAAGGAGIDGDADGGWVEIFPRVDGQVAKGGIDADRFLVPAAGLGDVDLADDEKSGYAEQNDDSSDGDQDREQNFYAGGHIRSNDDTSIVGVSFAGRRSWFWLPTRCSWRLRISMLRPCSQSSAQE
jgi:hypothetical protein